MTSKDQVNNLLKTHKSNDIAELRKIIALFDIHCLFSLSVVDNHIRRVTFILIKTRYPQQLDQEVIMTNYLKLIIYRMLGVVPVGYSLDRKRNLIIKR